MHLAFFKRKTIHQYLSNAMFSSRCLTYCRIFNTSKGSLLFLSFKYSIQKEKNTRKNVHLTYLSSLSLSFEDNISREIRARTDNRKYMLAGIQKRLSQNFSLLRFYKLNSFQCRSENRPLHLVVSYT
ncbi:hypothetical protein V8G54_028386 [Vigna mungo]|uniref:Uncharacterized protein n=1 Tax=Vigna mungo TaxID=3915 RepID=A0AAQ3RLM1_VIGMU